MQVSEFTSLWSSSPELPTVCKFWWVFCRSGRIFKIVCITISRPFSFYNNITIFFWLTHTCSINSCRDLKLLRYLELMLYGQKGILGPKSKWQCLTLVYEPVTHIFETSRYSLFFFTWYYISFRTSLHLVVRDEILYVHLHRLLLHFPWLNMVLLSP